MSQSKRLRRRKERACFQAAYAKKASGGRRLSSDEVVAIAEEHGWNVRERTKAESDPRDDDTPWWTPEEWEAGCRGIAPKWDRLAETVRRNNERKRRKK